MHVVTRPSQDQTALCLNLTFDMIQRLLTSSQSSSAVATLIFPDFAYGPIESGRTMGYALTVQTGPSDDL